MKTTILQPEFVEMVPEELKGGILYISIPFATAIHLCACGCGNEVVTPFSPEDWKLIFYGESVSLYPSIGNWNFPCRSHYWITKNAIEPARGERPHRKSQMSDQEKRRSKRKLFKWKKKK